MRKSERQELIIDAIRSRKVTSQGELADILRDSSYTVTQASISRDLDELGVVKIDGIYQRPELRSEAGFPGLLGIEASGENLLVARCRSGLASAVAVRLDAARIPEIVGTIAGDDTIFIAVKDARSQRTVTKKALELFSAK
jgi:transcriptional regulator of arginine metabolism